MEEVFTRHGEQIREGDILKLRVCLSAQKPDIAIGFGLQKGGRDTVWSSVQQSILDKIMPSKLKSGRFASITNFVLLKADRRELDFEEVREDVDRQLNSFIQSLKQFENQLAT